MPAPTGTQSRIDRRFAALKRDARPAFVTFITGGDPDYETSKEILLGLPRAGADVIEIGMPFSDPMADGPAVQASSVRALKAGQTMKRTLQLVRDFRATDDDTPIILMGYYNPIYVYPSEAFLDDAKAAGVDGMIVVDVPPEADNELCLPAIERGLSIIRLATPTTDDARLPAVLANTSGLRLLCLDHRDHGRRGAGRHGCGRTGGADQALHIATGRRRLRRQDAGTGPRHRRLRRWRGGRLGAGRGDPHDARAGWPGGRGFGGGGAQGRARSGIGIARIIGACLMCTLSATPCQPGSKGPSPQVCHN